MATGEVQELTGEVQELEAGVIAYSEEADKLRKARALITEQLRATQNELQAAQDLLQAVFVSSSWRLTAPVRTARIALRNIVGRGGAWISLFVRSLQGNAPAAEQPRRLVASPTQLPDPGVYVPLNNSQLKATPSVRAIAFYLPQFHPIRENDSFWGRGFTEWTNVSRATPQFQGQYQPRLPGELGFYDLRVIDVQRRQVELAKLYGIGRFCFYFYWFGGKRVLEHPLEQYLAHGDMDLPFCLCWANENWTRTWDGGSGEVLLEQAHSPSDDLTFIAYVSKYLKDERYIRVNNKPLLLVYRPSLLPSAKVTARRWRKWCRENGVGEILLAYVQSFENPDPVEYDFDAAIEFPPNGMGCPLYPGELQLINPAFSGVIYDWDFFRRRSEAYEVPPYTLFRGVCPSWDNEPRRPSRGAVMLGSSPEGYCEWLKNAILDTLKRFKDPSERLIFINAWNEWAEGAYLEPDNRYGYGYLQATRTALEATAEQQRQQQTPVHPDGSELPVPTKAGPRLILVGHDAHPHGAQLNALSLLREFRQVLKLQVECVLLKGGKLKPDYEKIAPVHCLDDVVPPSEEAHALIGELRARGFQTAICNTIVSGRLAKILKKEGFHIVSLVHELPTVIENYEGKGLRDEARAIAEAADRIVFPAPLVADKFGNYAHVAKSKVVIQPQGLYKHNAVRTRSEIAHARRILRENLGVAPTTNVVLSVGFGDERKGIDLFVEIGNRVLSSSLDMIFLWVGNLDGAVAESIRSRVAQSEHASRFIFPGFFSDTDHIFAGADVLALPSREDPFPAVLLEAFDVGLPVVCFAGVGGFDELIQENRIGTLVPPFDVAAFADAIRATLGKSRAREATSVVARSVLAREFSFRKYAYDLANLAQLPVKRTSVIVPTYNYRSFLEARLATIEGQTVAPYEVIVLDDASSDGSAEWLRDNLPRMCPHSELIMNERNSGSVFRQWLTGVEHARGDYVWIAEADDLAHPEFLEETLRAFDDPEVVMSFCQSRQMASDGQVLCEDYLQYVADISPTKWTERYVNEGVDEIISALSVKNTIPNVSAVVFRRDVLLAALRAKIDDLRKVRVAGDWLAYVELLQHGKIAFSPRSLNYHRRHSSSVTLNSFDLSQLREIMSVQKAIRHKFAIPEPTARAAEAYAERLFQQFGLATDQVRSVRQHRELSSLCLPETFCLTGRSDHSHA